MRLFTLAVAVAALCFLSGASFAADKAGCICGPDCTCAADICPGKCPVVFVYDGERFGYESIIVSKNGNTCEVGAVVIGTFPPRIKPLGFTELLRIVSGPFDAPCPNGRCPAASKPTAAAGTCSSGSCSTGSVNRVRPLHRVREVIQSRPRLFGRR